MAAVAAFVVNVTKWFIAILNLHVTPMPPHQVLAQSDLTFGSRWGLKIFKMATLEGHLRYWNRTTLAILNLYVPPMPHIMFGLNPHYGLGGDAIWTILAILNLHVTPMLLIVSAQSNWQFGRDVVWRISRWPQLQPAWIPEWTNFSNSESLCRSGASH